MDYGNKDDIDQSPAWKESLSQQVARGGFWVFALRITDRGLGFIRLIILARLLTPDDFGLLGISLLALSILGTFSGTGFGAALIQKKERTDEYLDTAWTVQIIRGIVLFAILFTVSPLVAIFFNTPEAASIIKVLAFTQLLGGFNNIGIVYFRKELEFHKQFIYSFVSSVVAMLVAISLAFILRNVWALVFGLLAGNVTALILSYIICSYRPKIEFNLAKIKELFGFGKWILGSSILIFLGTHGDDVFVGKLLGVATLGLYQMAYRLSNMPATEITHMISQVTFPAYSKMQDNIPRLRESYLRVLQLTSFLSFPIAGLIFVLAPDFTKIFLGQKWLPIVFLIKILVISGLIRSIAATTGPIFSAIGEPKIETHWQAIRLAVLCILIYPCAVQWGIMGVAASVVASTMISTIGFSKMAIKITRCNFKIFSKIIFLPFMNSLMTITLIQICRRAFITIGIFEFIILSSVGIISTFAFIYLFDRLFNYKGLFLIKDFYASTKGVHKI